MDNGTDFASGFVRIAMEEFYAHNSNNLTGLVKRYWDIVDQELADPRAVQFPFMENPLPTLGFVLTYLAWVLVVGPIYMRDRKPFQLRNTLIYYNAGQVLLSAYMFYEHLMAGWAASYDYSCEKVDYSDGSQSRRMLNLCYVYYLSKLTEFMDTIFFVCRKKKTQITWLHLYHHSLTPLEAWILVKFIAGGNATLPNLINNFVHVCMYFYYMMSAMGPQYQKYLWWKKYMTELQIIQFVICIGHTVRALCISCEFPWFMSVLLLLNSSIFFVLFMNFYVHSYNKRATPPVAPQQLTATISPALIGGKGATTPLLATMTVVAKKID